MRKTKIVCTLGPSSDDAATIRKLVDAGMDVARLNFSHGTPETHLEVLERVREAAREAGREVAILQDLPGPKIRSGDGPEVELVAGSDVAVLPGVGATEPGKIGCTYAELGRELSRGKHILLSDGTLELEVVEARPEELRCRVLRGGVLKPRQGMNLPGADLSARPPTETDLRFIEWGIDHGVDYIALSFVKGAEDIRRAKEGAGTRAKDVRFVAKIEREEALEELDAIFEAADAIMVARGDLGVELPPEKVPHLQRDMIRRANLADKPVITATQMLESMTEQSRPTRAEVSDVAHAVWDGTDAVMLSAETASGRHPIESVSVMSRIAREAERDVGPGGVLGRHATPGPTPDPSMSAHGGTAFMRGPSRSARGGAEDVMGLAAELIARCLGGKAVVVATMSGQSARFVSMARPCCPIIGLSPVERSRRRMALYRGVIPVAMEEMKDPEGLVGEARRAAREVLGEPQGLVVLVYGSPVGSGVKANTVRLVRIEEA